VGQALAQERSKLLELPADAFPTDERVEVKARKTPYIRVDLNDYSIHARGELTVLASLERVRIFAETELIAEHSRSWDAGQTVGDPAHV